MRICLACGASIDSGWDCRVCGSSPKNCHTHLSFVTTTEEEQDGFRKEYFIPLSRIESEHFWFTSRNRLLDWAIRHHFPRSRTFFEIGCGTGFVLSGIRQALPQLTLAGSDYFDAGLKVASQRLPDVSLFRMDAR